MNSRWFSSSLLDGQLCLGYLRKNKQTRVVRTAYLKGRRNGGSEGKEIIRIRVHKTLKPLQFLAFPYEFYGALLES